MSSFMMEAAWSSSPAKRRKTPSKSLPTTELREEDDWTRVKDPKEKKRIQNRVAQRTYRHRMKARLGELQARLDSHEGRAPPPNGTGNQTSNHMTSPDHHLSDGSRSMTSTWNANPTPPGRGSSEETSSPLEAKPSLAQLGLIQHGGLYDPSSAASTTSMPDPSDTTSLFQDHQQGHFLNSPPRSQPSPQAHGLLSPPGQAGSDPTSKPPDFMLDCLRFQTQLLNRLNTVQQDGSYANPYGQADSVTSLSSAEQANCVPAPFTPTHPEGMEFSFDASSSEALNFPPMPGHMGSVLDAAAAAAAAASDIHPPIPSSTKTSASVPATLPSSSAQQQKGSLDERFERVMDAVEAAGFDSFDSLATTYYSAAFSEASPLAHEQRLSRNRRLPKVVSDVFHAADQWSSWERTGFHEELLRSTEAMLLREGAGARGALRAKLTPALETQKMMGTPISGETMLAMKRTVQEELPNSWALSMALAADQRASWQSDRSNTALATVLLLNFAGRMPKDDLLGLLGACL